MSERIYTPVSPPATPEDTTELHAELTDAQEDMRKKVLDHFSKPGYTIPDVENGDLSDDEKFWLSHECMLRYLRATKWTWQKSIERLEQTLKWRREFGIYDLVTADHVEPEAVTGKEILFGFDTHRRPALYMIPSRQNTNEGTRQVQFVVWTLERCIDLMGPGVETVDLLINFAEKAKNPSFSTSKTVLNILQDHYPERLGLSIVINVPFLVNAFFKLINPFIDPMTRSKLKFNPKVVEDNIFKADMVMKEWWGGDCDFVYEHDKYWPALVEMCEERSRAWMERWRALGGTVGLREWDYKGGKSQISEKVEVELEMPKEIIGTVEVGKAEENGKAAAAEALEASKLQRNCRLI